MLKITLKVYCLKSKIVFLTVLRMKNFISSLIRFFDKIELHFYFWIIIKCLLVTEIFSNQFIFFFKTLIISCIIISLTSSGFSKMFSYFYIFNKLIKKFFTINDNIAICYFYRSKKTL